MNNELFESLPIVGVYVVVVILMMIFGGLLAMLAFVLAFTFSMASSQNDVRKQNVLEEANYIGTSYLRADLLDKQYEIEVKRLLREYVKARLEAAAGSNIDVAIAKSVEFHNLLWAQVSSAAGESPNTNTSLMVQSINDVIDMHEKRITGALRNRIPDVVWIALVAIVALTMITMGTQVGFTGKRRLVAVFPLILAFAVLVTLVVDLNRPQSGLITVGQQSMADLQISMGRFTTEI
jgi:hypothetical protein